MFCNNGEDYLNTIKNYFSSDLSGYPFIVNIDEQSVYQQVLFQLKADNSKTVKALSKYCNGDNLPDVFKAMSDVKNSDNCIFTGFSQYYMFRGYHDLQAFVSEICSLSVKGKIVFIICGCSKILKDIINRDLRIEYRVAISEKSEYIPPVIKLINIYSPLKNIAECKNIKELFEKLEGFDYSDISKIKVATKFSPATFENSMIDVSEYKDVFGVLSEKYQEIKSSMTKEWGTENQWEDMLEKMSRYGSFSLLIESILGSTVNLSSYISETFKNLKSMESWYLWLAMKIFGTKENEYLGKCVKKSKSCENLVDLIYNEILDYDTEDENFYKYYSKRKKLLQHLPEDYPRISHFCNRVGQFEEKEIYYLTDLTESEKNTFMKALDRYDYSKEEILKVTEYAFPEIYEYLQEFEFSDINTKIPSGDKSVQKLLTDYFEEYKLQKVTNRIHDDFSDKVNKYAEDRPYNKLLPRINIVNDIDKTNAQIHFFDALGVEYLSYIISKCRKYGLQTVVHIAHCELPSITSKNLDFKKYIREQTDSDGNVIFPETKELDELKHHSKKIDYTTCKEPVYIFWELEIIDKEISKIQKLLIDGDYDKIIIVSDHGASRLAVINQSESELYELDNKAGHSGRCCETNVKTDIPYVAYDNGFAVLANYDRFKGGRKANVEVHGGATLEETVVPIIEISKIPENVEIYFVNNYIEFHNKEIVAPIVYSDINILSPKLYIKQLGDKPYNGVDIPGGRNYKFEIPEIKRSGTFTADLYDGDKLLCENMEFRVKKAVGTTKNYF